MIPFAGFNGWFCFNHMCFSSFPWINQNFGTQTISCSSSVRDFKRLICSSPINKRLARSCPGWLDVDEKTCWETRSHLEQTMSILMGFIIQISTSMWILVLSHQKIFSFFGIFLWWDAKWDHQVQKPTQKCLEINIYQFKHGMPSYQKNGTPFFQGEQTKFEGLFQPLKNGWWTLTFFNQPFLVHQTKGRRSSFAHLATGRRCSKAQRLGWSPQTTVFFGSLWTLFYGGGWYKLY